VTARTVAEPITSGLQTVLSSARAALATIAASAQTPATR
jgi:hypothetical protein